MSLRPDDRSSRHHSKSHERSRSRSAVRTSKEPSPPRKASSSSRYAPPSPPSSTYDDRALNGSHPPADAYTSWPPPQAPYPPQGSVPHPADEEGAFTMGGYSDYPPHMRPGYVPPTQMPDMPGMPLGGGDGDLAYGETTSPYGSRHASYSTHVSQSPYQVTQVAPSGTAGVRYAPQPAGSVGTARPTYTTKTSSSQSTFQYAKPPEKITYTTRPQGQSEVRYATTPHTQFHEQDPRYYSQNSYGIDAHVVTVTPGGHSRQNSSAARPGLLSAGSSGGLSSRMDRLSVSGNRPDVAGLGAGGMPPPSPLLEPYHGTYQSMSPLPLALRMNDDDIDDLPPLSPAGSRAGSPEPLGRAIKGNARFAEDVKKAGASEKKRVKLYDAEDDTKALAEALHHHHSTDADAVIDVLAPLNHDRIMELRKEYKKQVKIQGKGVNLSKHIKMKLTGNFGKAAYVTSLGKWESEGYWANFWYQSHGSRRELLIESLMGRTNREIDEIKREFKDKRYGDSLEKCMEKELKMDKFRTAVLMVLEERRQEEQDVYPREYIDRDVEMLYRCLTAKQGGESAMLEIIVRRSDAHLKEVLHAYETTHGQNLARAALSKSSNLVGEVVAHILNGVINKPARDAMLLRHAIKDIADKNRSDELRYELLISRVVRLHWDKTHLIRVKQAYRQKYGKQLEQDIGDATKGDFGDFMIELCRVK